MRFMTGLCNASNLRSLYRQSEKDTAVCSKTFQLRKICGSRNCSTSVGSAFLRILYNFYAPENPVGLLDDLSRPQDAQLCSSCVIMGTIPLTSHQLGSLDYYSHAGALDSLKDHRIFVVGEITEKFVRNILPHADIWNIQDLTSFTYPKTLPTAYCGVVHNPRPSLLFTRKAVLHPGLYQSQSTLRVELLKTPSDFWMTSADRKTHNFAVHVFGTIPLTSHQLGSLDYYSHTGALDSLKDHRIFVLVGEITN